MPSRSGGHNHYGRITVLDAFNDFLKLWQPRSNISGDKTMKVPRPIKVFTKIFSDGNSGLPAPSDENVNDLNRRGSRMPQSPI
jgi:hypothetical protein